MAFVIYQLREEASRILLENGTAGKGALQRGELGFNNSSGGDVSDLTFSYNPYAGSTKYHLASIERLAYASTAALSGAKLSGYKPSGSLISTNVQDALDELAAGAGGGGGGGIGGSLTTGKLLKASGANAATDSILSEASNKILFSADAVANLYRAAAGYLQTDGGFGVTGQFDADGLVNLPKLINACGGFDFGNASANNAFAFIIAPTLDKNNSSVRAFSALLLAPTLNPGGSNNFTTLNILNIDPGELTNTGLLTNLIRLGYNGSDLWAINSVGDLILSGAGQTIRRANDTGHTFLCGGSTTSSSNGAMIFLSGVNDSTWAGKLRLYSGVGAFIEHFGATYFSDFEQMQQKSSTPAAPTDGTTLNRYFKGTKFILQYYDGGTVRYKYLELSGTGATWADSTSAP